ncbi:uncharacterized protein BDR25DRAFT_350884 [Lindgomyces ingoldianus]|uniref:Uncharacterized protein n=1 Tax=Lindgomyces ingoldianus TaxID=673940 RepID=A0ACB6R9V0_9PLEO|nr:uncharacterized protein BDR25DRAFT_350884 [Lindgomyces ingoldianus]KAF2475538.1 hypothetical protein BDR25DRAFT_350884 [Lindgomyces ingoldianus]
MNGPGCVTLDLVKILELFEDEVIKLLHCRGYSDPGRITFTLTMRRLLSNVCLLTTRPRATSPTLHANDPIYHPSSHLISKLTVTLSSKPPRNAMECLDPYDFPELAWEEGVQIINDFNWDELAKSNDVSFSGETQKNPEDSFAGPVPKIGIEQVDVPDIVTAGFAYKEDVGVGGESNSAQLANDRVKYAVGAEIEEVHTAEQLKVVAQSGIDPSHRPSRREASKEIQTDNKATTHETVTTPEEISTGTLSQEIRKVPYYTHNFLLTKEANTHTLNVGLQDTDASAKETVHSCSDYLQDTMGDVLEVVSKDPYAVPSPYATRLTGNWTVTADDLGNGNASNITYLPRPTNITEIADQDFSTVARITKPAHRAKVTHMKEGESDETFTPMDIDTAPLVLPKNINDLGKAIPESQDIQSLSIKASDGLRRINSEELLALMGALKTRSPEESPQPELGKDITSSEIHYGDDLISHSKAAAGASEHTLALEQDKLEPDQEITTVPAAEDSPSSQQMNLNETPKCTKVSISDVFHTTSIPIRTPTIHYPTKANIPFPIHAQGISVITPTEKSQNPRAHNKTATCTPTEAPNPIPTPTPTPEVLETHPTIPQASIPRATSLPSEANYSQYSRNKLREFMKERGISRRACDNNKDHRRKLLESDCASTEPKEMIALATDARISVGSVEPAEMEMTPSATTSAAVMETPASIREGLKPIHYSQHSSDKLKGLMKQRSILRKPTDRRTDYIQRLQADDQVHGRGYPELANANATPSTAKHQHLVLKLSPGTQSHDETPSAPAAQKTSAGFSPTLSPNPTADTVIGWVPISYSHLSSPSLSSFVKDRGLHFAPVESKSALIKKLQEHDEACSRDYTEVDRPVIITLVSQRGFNGNTAIATAQMIKTLVNGDVKRAKEHLESVGRLKLEGEVEVDREGLERGDEEGEVEESGREDNGVGMDMVTSVEGGEVPADVDMEKPMEKPTKNPTDKFTENPQGASSSRMKPQPDVQAGDHNCCKPAAKLHDADASDNKTVEDLPIQAATVENGSDLAYDSGELQQKLIVNDEQSKKATVETEAKASIPDAQSRPEGLAPLLPDLQWPTDIVTTSGFFTKAISRILSRDLADQKIHIPRASFPSGSSIAHSSYSNDTSETVAGQSTSFNGKLHDALVSSPQPRMPETPTKTVKFADVQGEGNVEAALDTPSKVMVSREGNGKLEESMGGFHAGGDRNAKSDAEGDMSEPATPTSGPKIATTTAAILPPSSPPPKQQQYHIPSSTPAPAPISFPTSTSATKPKTYSKIKGKRPLTPKNPSSNRKHDKDFKPGEDGSDEGWESDVRACKRRKKSGSRTIRSGHTSKAENDATASRSGKSRKVGKPKGESAKDKAKGQDLDTSPSAQEESKMNVVNDGAAGGTVLQDLDTSGALSIPSSSSPVGGSVNSKDRHPAETSYGKRTTRSEAKARHPVSQALRTGALGGASARIGVKVVIPEKRKGTERRGGDGSGVPVRKWALRSSLERKQDVRGEDGNGVKGGMWV